MKKKEIIRRIVVCLAAAVVLAAGLEALQVWTEPRFTETQAV